MPRRNGPAQICDGGLAGRQGSDGRNRLYLSLPGLSPGGLHCWKRITTFYQKPGLGNGRK